MWRRGLGRVERGRTSTSRRHVCLYTAVIGETSVWGGGGLKVSARCGMAEASTPSTPPARQRGRRRGGANAGEHALCPFVRREGAAGSALGKGASTPRPYALHMGKVGIRRKHPPSISATHATRSAKRQHVAKRRRTNRANLQCRTAQSGGDKAPRRGTTALSKRC